MSQTKIGVGMINATSIGDAKVLQGDGSWVTPSAGALTFISTTDFSDTATYDFISGFDASSYEHYVFYLQNLVPASDDVHLWCRTSTDATNFDAGASDYMWGGQSSRHMEDIDTADSRFSITGDDASIAATVGSAAGESGVFGVITLFGPHATAYTQMKAEICVPTAESSFGFSIMGGIRLSAANVDGFRILFEGGNIESGTITAYGLANS